MKLVCLFFGVLFILAFIGMHESCPMGHHEIDFDIDPDQTDKKE